MSFLPTFSRRIALACAFSFILVALIQAAAINPPTPGQSIPDLFFGCAGCVRVSPLAPQTVMSSNGNWQAVLTTAVFNDPNPIAGIRTGPGLDFFYQLQVLPCGSCTSGPDNIGRFTAISFNTVPGLLVDVGFNIGSVSGFNSTGTATPGVVDRVPPGDVIGWTFAAPGAVGLAPGTTSVIMEVATNAVNFTTGHAAAIDGGTANFLSFQPAP